MDTIGILITLFKFVGIASSGIFGAIGLTHDYKDKRGRITRWGWIALWGIGSSFIVSAASETLLILKDRNAEQRTAEKALKEAERANLTLAQVNRAVHPLRDLLITFAIGVPQDPALKGYRERLKSELPRFFADEEGAPGSAFFKWKAATVSRGAKGEHYTIALHPGSPLLPREADEPVAAGALDSGVITIDFFRAHIPVTNYHGCGPILNHDKKADLTVYVGSTLSGVGFGLKEDKDPKVRWIDVEYDVEREKLSIVSHVLPSDMGTWQGNGSITSAIDFDHAQLFVRPSMRGLTDNLTEKAIEKIRRGFVITMLDLNLAGGKVFRMTDKDMKRYSDMEGFPYSVSVLGP
jgi:hypothetical protein